MMISNTEQETEGDASSSTKLSMVDGDSLVLRELELYESILSTMIMNLWVKIRPVDQPSDSDNCCLPCQSVQDSIRNVIGVEHPYLNIVIQDGKFVNIEAKEEKESANSDGEEKVPFVKKFQQRLPNQSTSENVTSTFITRDEFIEFGRHPHDFSKSLVWIEVGTNGFILKLSHSAADARFLLYLAHRILSEYTMPSNCAIQRTRRPFRNVMANLKPEGLAVAMTSFSSPSSTSFALSDPLYFLINRSETESSTSPSNFTMIPSPPVSLSTGGINNRSEDGMKSHSDEEVAAAHIRPRFGRFDPSFATKLKSNVKSRGLSFQAVLNVALSVAILKSHHLEVERTDASSKAHLRSNNSEALQKQATSGDNQLVVLLNAYSMEQDMTTMKIDKDECIPGGAGVWIPIRIDEGIVAELISLGAKSVPAASTVSLMWKLIQQSHDTFQQQVTKNCGQYHMFACMNNGLAAPQSTMFCTNVGKSPIQGSYEYQPSSAASSKSIPSSAHPLSPVTLQVEDVHFMGGVDTNAIKQVKSPGLSLHAFVQQDGWNFTLGYTYPFYSDEVAQQLLDDTLDCLQLLAVSA